MKIFRMNHYVHASSWNTIGFSVQEPGLKCFSRCGLVPGFGRNRNGKGGGREKWLCSTFSHAFFVLIEIGERVDEWNAYHAFQTGREGKE